MNFKNKKRIYLKLKQKAFSPRHVAEVGVYYPETSNLYDFIMEDIKTTLVEPDPESIKRIKTHFRDNKNITLHEVAIFDRTGTIALAQRDASTFISELDTSPAIVNDDYDLSSGDMFNVTARTFDEIDDGSIDLLSVDIEGSEWYVIKNMRSRPDVISIETHGAIYTNPKIVELTDWLNKHDYVVWYKDRSDTVYVKRGAIAISMYDRFALRMYEIYLKLRKNRKLLKRKLKALFKS